MQLILQNLIGGLQMGSIYALIALGYTMVYGIVKLINFAHGDVMMVGAYAVFWVMTTTLVSSFAESNPVLAIVFAVVFAIAFCVALGVLMDQVAYKPLRGAPRISALITAIGISMALQIGAQLIFGSGQVKFPNVIPKVVLFKVGRKPVQLLEVLTMVISILLMIGLQLFVKKTRTGKAMRAVSEDQGAAQLMGVNVNGTISLTFAIGSALAAIAGVLLCSAYPVVTPYTGAMPGIKAFVAAVFGGIGSIPGAMIGGILLGVIEILGRAYISSQVADAIVFGVLIIVLLVRPTGLFGKNVQEKV